MADHYMSVVYKHPAIEVQGDDHYKMIVATHDIQVGELLIIEHVFHNTELICEVIIQHNEYLFNQYHPRKIKWSDSIENIQDIRHEKFLHNAFNLNKKCIITDLITKMNHSCDPNCCIYIHTSGNDTRPSSNGSITFDTIVFAEIYALQTIPKGYEITLSYSPTTGHSNVRDFICKCGRTLDQRKTYTNTVKEMIKLICMKSPRKEIIAKISAYLKTVTAKKILTYQALANSGIFINDHQIKALSNEGRKFIDDLFNENKLTLFMPIIHGKIYEAVMKEKFDEAEIYEKLDGWNI